MAQLLKWLALSFASSAVLAAPTHDPTRPPPEFMPASGIASAPATEPLILQSVVLSPQRQIAIISGQQVSVGQKIRGLELISLNAQEAVLRGPQGQITLHLLTGAKIKKRQTSGDTQ